MEGLEAGVAGLVYGAVGRRDVSLRRVARGHPEPNSWSAIPVVIFAADRVHAEALRPLVEGCGCGFDFDPVRPELLVIKSRSVEDTLRLGDAVLALIEAFRSLG